MTAQISRRSAPTKTRAAAAVLGVVVAVGLAACNSDSSSDDRATTTRSDATSAAQQTTSTGEKSSTETSRVVAGGPVLSNRHLRSSGLDDIPGSVTSRRGNSELDLSGLDLSGVDVRLDASANQGTTIIKVPADATVDITATVRRGTVVLPGANPAELHRDGNLHLDGTGSGTVTINATLDEGTVKVLH